MQISNKIDTDLRLSALKFWYAPNPALIYENPDIIVHCLLSDESYAPGILIIAFCVVLDMARLKNSGFGKGTRLSLMMNMKSNIPVVYSADDI